MTTTPRFVGIDIAKAYLDVVDRPEAAPARVPNDEASIAALVERLSAAPPTLIVL